MNAPVKPSVLFVYYTHTQQILRVAQAMAEVLRQRGCIVSLAGIDLADTRYAIREEVRRVPLPARAPGYSPRVACAGTRRHRGDPHPGSGAEGRLRPGLLRLADLVVQDQLAVALIPE